MGSDDFTTGPLIMRVPTSVGIREVYGPAPDDGVALNRISHPGSPAMFDEDAEKVQPPPEYAGMPLHCLDAGAGLHVWAEWRVGSSWNWRLIGAAAGEICHFSAQEMAARGYRYLGPARFPDGSPRFTQGPDGRWFDAYGPEPGKFVTSRGEYLALRPEDEAWGERTYLNDQGEIERRVVTNAEAFRVSFSIPLGVLSETHDAGPHDYIGPTKPDPAHPGRRLPVPDPTHERFHRAVGDVMTGKVLPEARRQMQEALKRAPKEPVRAPDAILRGNKAGVGLIGR